MKLLNLKFQTFIKSAGILIIILVSLLITPFNLEAETMNNQEKTTEKDKYTNKLINETSPYLLQHAHNPVHWYPWGKEAFEKAEKENKPIFLSIGYSTCHWCHVMEEESFKNEQTADLLNKYFIPIKVDKEELPAVNDIYMRFVVMTTERGGWPLSVFLTPKLKPFFGGTYFPSKQSYGMPSFDSVLETIAASWKDKKKDINKYADMLSEQINRSFKDTQNVNKPELSNKLIENAVKILGDQFDPKYGGFGTSLKFPRASNLELFLQYYYHTNDKNSLNIIETSLDNMTYGGIKDQIAGGFHRYTLDRNWLTPHFEKMLYDNALLSKLYFNAYLLTKKKLYLNTGIEVLDYVLREMQDKNAGFYTAQDADSEGEEGKYYIWTKKEIEKILGTKNADIFCRYYNITPEGNFEGKNILNITQTPESIAIELNISMEVLEESIEQAKSKILKVRNKRIHPQTDDKIIASINGLMISAFTKGYQATLNKKYLNAAVNAGNFLSNNMVIDGHLKHSFRLGKAKGYGYLDDYAFTASAFVDLYVATFDVKWLLESDFLIRQMIKLFWDKNHGGFYSTSNEHKSLISRPKGYDDSSTPSGNSVAALLLMKLSIYFNNKEYEKMANKILHNSYTLMKENPQSSGGMLEALFFELYTKNEIVIVGNIENNKTLSLINTVYSYYIPNRLISVLEDKKSEEKIFNNSYMFSTKPKLNDEPTAYVCKNFACKQPVNSVAKLKELLKSN